MDGLFLAVNTGRVLEKSIKFDEEFEFHFYDLDFCRQCISNGLILGTWPIAVTHASGGAFGSEPWREAAQRYIDKWK